MLQLIKYEIRKSTFSKIVMLAALGICELIFLFGVFFTDIEKSFVTVWGIAGLVIVTVVGISFIGIESLLTLHKDLNTKQSYMLFMTPRSGFQILGAKILENAFVICMAALFFLILATIDIGILLTKLGGFKAMLLVLQDMMDLDIDWEEIRIMAVVVFGESVIGWFSMIVTGFLAIILSASVFAGRKFNSLVTFLLYGVLVFVQERIILFIMKQFKGNLGSIGELILYGAISAVFAVVIYIGSCLIVEKKLSV